jgi:hypothetical protein
MTGKLLHDSSEGIWDDGEWISWDWINGQLAAQELQAEYPAASLEVIEVFEGIVGSARDYREATGRYLQIWGELGELYAEIKYGLQRHAPGAQGSDGRLGNDWVEVKTISPEKTKQTIQVKRAGNFNKLLIVKISEEFEFEAKLIDRKQLKKGKGRHARISWGSDD